MKKLILKMAMGMALLLPCAALAWNDVYWDAADGAFTEASNWRNGTAPTSAASLVRVANDGIMRISSDFTFSPAIRVGFGAGTGTVIQTGGAVSATTVAGIQGNNTLGIGNENMSDTATGESLWRISAGSLTSTYYAQIGQYGRGALEICGPTAAVVTKNYTSIGRFTGGVGRVVVSEGSFTVEKNGLIVGEAGVGTLTVLSNGVATVNGTFRLGATANGEAYGTVNVADGGLLVAPEVTTLRSGEFHFAGGTWQVNASGQTIATLFPSQITCAVGDGGILLDVGSNDVTVPNPLATEPDSVGGLVKLGSGTLRLTAANTYGGATIVSNGILYAASAASLPGYDRPGGVTVAEGAYLVTGDGWTAAELETLAANAVYEGNDANAYTWADGILTGAFGNGIPADKYLKLAGGAFAGADGVVTNALGTSPGQIAFQSGATAGFSANAADVTVTLPETLVWGSPYFSPAALLLNHANAGGDLVFASDVDLNGVGTAVIGVDAKTATIAGNVSDVDNATELQKVGAGTLALAGTNAFGSVKVMEGTFAMPTGTTTIAGTLWQRFGATALTGGVFTAQGVRFEEGSSTVANCRLQVSGTVRVGATSNTTNPGKLTTRFSNCELDVTTLALGADTVNQRDTIPLDNVDATLGRLVVYRGSYVQNGGTLRSAGSGDGADWQIGGVMRMDGINWTMNGGAIVCGRHFQVGAMQCSGGVDVLSLQNGATVEVSGYPSIGRFNYSTGRIDVVNGTFTQSAAAKSFNIGENGDGTLHVFRDGVVNAAKLLLAYEKNKAGSAHVIVDKGGTLNVGSIVVGSGTGVKELRINGGKIRATGADGAEFAVNLTSLDVGPDGLEFDTNGKVAIFGDPKASPSTGSSRLKKGNMLHRWSFNGDLEDSVGGQTATLVGSGATLTTDGKCRLTGGTKGSGYISLGSGILPRAGEGLTLEVWGTQRQLQSWSRIFTIGNGMTQDMLMSWSNGSSADVDCICIKEASGDITGKLASYLFNVEYHIAMTVEPSASQPGRWTVTCYKQNATTGETIKKHSFTTNNDTWSPFTQVCNDAWLGHSHHGDNDASADFNEFRVWNVALTETELTQSAQMGADAALGGARVVKTGEGRLVVRDGVAVVGGADVREGTLEVGPHALAHRWSFNGDLTDSVGNQTATMDGGATLSATQVTLSGGAHGAGAVLLGSNVMPTGTTGLTLEFWATQNAVQSWSRIFEIGSSLNNSILMTWTAGTDINTDDVCIKLSNDGKNWRDYLAPYTLGKEFHVVLTIAPNVNGTWHVTAYRQDPEGVLADKTVSFDTTGTWSPATQNQTDCYLGRSHASADNDASASYNEVRVWNFPMTAQQVAASLAAGPDALPQLDDATATFAEGAFVSVAAGATLDLSCGTHAVDALVGAGTVANGSLTGTIQPGGAGTVATLTLNNATLAGTLKIDATDTGACDALVSTGPFDARGLAVELEEGAVLAPGHNYVIATFAPNAFTGPFAGATLPNGWKLRVNEAAGTVKLAGGGCAIIIR